MAESSSPYAFYAFYRLYSHFYRAPKLSLDTVNELLYQGKGLKPEFARCPLFVTWKKLDKNEYQLRGCIGTFAESKVEPCLDRYALISALQDSRFAPMQSEELPLLSCGCNLLSQFKTIYKSEGAGTTSKSTAGDIWDWEVGKHGIELKFRDPKTQKRMSATFLPEVIPEQGWDQRETFENLIAKAGCWKYVEEVMEHWEKYFDEVIRYEGTKSEISWKEFETKYADIIEESSG
ncbi:unnamed protein product [Kluyveromyces dobzhanskii CBS 2104]|uniref:WGS project CCBQ000000000 data, contig 00098 n=1 Tax=Kluyveromyces dobzhanskii CBS 2104 TaxID=1427455 RepID=A0A0A8L5G4_9SACH|nr:unnamed protein product [Kluyveromyces dobzhanskii CBS 2104]